MSAAAKAGKTPVGRAVDALSLALVFGILYLATRLAPTVHGDAGLIAALGFLLLAGTLMSELIEVLGVPHLTGYLLAGIVAGPHVLHLIDHGSVERLAPVNTLALALIALAGGAELKIEGLKKGLKSLAVSTALHSVFGLLFVGGVFVLAAPPLIPFVRGMPTMALLGVGLLWGVMSITRSPSATLGVLSQTRANGPLANATLAFVMTSDVVVVVFLAGAITLARPLLDPSATITSTAFAALGHEILGSVSMGTSLGLLLSAYFRLVERQVLVVLVAVGFGATEMLHYLQFDPLLTFMVAGFVVQNLSKQGDKFVHALEEAGGIVYVVFFASAGAHLDVPLLRQLWPVAILLCGTRALLIFVLSRISSRMARDVPSVRVWGWAPLISQAGLALGLAAVVAREFPSFGPGFRALAIATVALNEMVGPILFKVALDRARETKAPIPSLSDAEEG